MDARDTGEEPGQEPTSPNSTSRPDGSAPVRTDGMAFLPNEDGEFNGNAPAEARPFSTYPEDRRTMLSLVATIEAKSSLDEDYVTAADKLADLVKAILTDEQALLDAEMFEQMTEEFSQVVDQSWENFKAATPVATVINDNQPGKAAIVEILSDPPTLAVGTKLYAAPVKVT